MGKKLPLLISTLIIVATGATISQDETVSATTITDTGLQAWSITEMNELYYQFQVEKDAICGNNPDCRRDLDFKRAESDPKYNALQAFSMSSFVLSSINPAENKFRLYFRDIDNMAMEMEGIEQHSPLTEAYIAWIDSDFTDHDYRFIDAMRNDLHPAGMHEIYKASTALNGANWFPVETEVEISVPDAHLELNHDNLIMLFGLNEPSSVLSWVRYDSCINSPNYQTGMECRLMYNENANYVYVPFWPEADSKTDSVPDSNSNLDTAPIPDSSLEPATNSAAPSVNNSNPEENLVSSSEAESILSSKNTQKTEKTENATAPNTGEVTASQDGSIEFPWWLGVIFTSGLAALIWLFWPNRQKSSKKS